MNATPQQPQQLAGWGTLYLEVQCKHQNGNRANPPAFIYGAKLALTVQFKSDRFPLRACMFRYPSR